MPIASAIDELEGSIAELERLCVEQGRSAEGLVLLAEYPVASLRAEVARAAELLCRRHPATVARAIEEARGVDDGALGTGSVSARDHPWFELSMGGLGGYFGCVAREPHGGNRPALGQYWRLVVEAVARRASEERATLKGLRPVLDVASRRY